MRTNNQATIPMEPGHNVDSSGLNAGTAARNVSVKALKDNWQKWSHQHQEYQRHNPFSHSHRPTAVAPQKGQDRYGRPVEGSMTELRGKDAHLHVSREVEELCEAIRTIGEPADGADGKVMSVQFGKLFEHYVTVSNKVVGILLRARKQGLIDFEGEMLWQGRDDSVVITLLE